MSRWKAAGIHLVASLLVALGVAALIFGLLYPPEFLSVTGALALFALIVGVDVVVGPFLTLLVFDIRKKSLKFDMATIVLLQLCAFSYGTYVTIQARPAFLVFCLDRFELVTATEIEYLESSSEVTNEHGSVPWAGPKLVAAVLPQDSAEKQRLLFISTAGADLQQFPKYFRSYDSQQDKVLKVSLPISSLIQRHPGSEGRIQEWLGERKLTVDQVRVLPLHARKGDLTAVVDSIAGKFLGAINVDPW